MTVTHQTRTILGVRATVVKDVIRRADGSIVEKTTDWYAPDNAGNVWYLGEETATCDENGSWRVARGPGWRARTGPSPG